MHGFISGEYIGCSKIFHCQRRKRSMTAAAVWLLELSWSIIGFCTTNRRRFLLSPCDYDRSVYRLPWRYSITHINVIRHNELHFHSTLSWAHFIWMSTIGMLPFNWLAFQVWFLWASPDFVHSDDSSKKVVIFPLVPIQQGLCGASVASRKFHGVSNVLQVCGNPECGAQFCDILRLPLLTHAQSISNQHPTGKQGDELCCSSRGVVLYACCRERHPCLPGTL